jgi:hypothetical protein
LLQQFSLRAAQFIVAVQMATALLGLPALCRAQIERIPRIAPTGRGLSAVADLGCRPDDPSFDNGAVITAAIRDNRVNDTLHFPGGAYYHSTTIDIGAKEGLAFTGQGLAVWGVAEKYLDESGRPHRAGNASARFVYVGPPNQPAWRVNGVGTRMVGINIQRGARGQEIERAGTVGIEFVREEVGPPTGKWSIDHCLVAGFDTGLYFKNSNNVDSAEFGYLRMESCRRAIFCDNGQTTTITFRHLQIHGQGETVFDLERGGNFLIGSLALVEPRLIFRLGRVGSNTCTYTIENLKVDNNAAGWRLVEMTRPGPLNLYVRGHIGTRAATGPDPIKLLKPRANARFKPPAWYQNVELHLWPRGRLVWPPKHDDR